MGNNKLEWDAVSTVIRNRVKQITENLFEVGIPEESETVIVKIETVDNITRITSCSCKQHSVRDVLMRGYCSATLAVLLYKMLPIYKQIKGEMLP